jgi:hypothetical protein
MDKAEMSIDILMNKAWPLVYASLKDMRMFFQNNVQFFREMGQREGPCSSAWLFGLITASGLALLAIPALKGAGIEPTYDLALVLIAINWLLLLVYGACFGVAAKIFGGREIVSAVNAFFYVAIALVVMRLLEMPALSARTSAMVASCNAGQFGEAVTAAISNSEVSRNANVMMLLAYGAFFTLAVRMQRQLYGFAWGRGILSAVLGMVFLIAIVILMQQPAISALACGYAR